MKIKHNLLKTLLIGMLVFAAAPMTSAISLKMPSPPFSAPEFKVTEHSQWLNSAPLTMRDLRGKVVMVDFWTFGCVNCTRSIPWLKVVENKYRNKDFQIIGVHTPEFDHERVRSNIIEKADSLGRHHPIVIDNGFKIWRSYKNRYWPAFFIVDKKGVVRGVYVGETHKGDRRARAIEGLIDKLLAEA